MPDSTLGLHSRYARKSDAEQLILLANQVQSALTESGSLQQLRPLSQAEIEEASSRCHCFLIEELHGGKSILGCAFIKPLFDETIVSMELGAARGLVTISQLPAPWLYLHSIMLRPESQGRGIGAHLICDFVGMLEQQHGTNGGTVLLNCWAGNQKLRAFYVKAGFVFLAVVPKYDFEIAVFYKQLVGVC